MDVLKRTTVMMVSTESIPQASPAESYTLVLDITGMKCAGCVGAVEKRLRQFQGVNDVSVNLMTGTAAVDCDANVAVEGPLLTEQLSSIGFPTRVRFDPRQRETVSDGRLESEAEHQELRSRQRQLVQLAIAATLVILSGVAHLGWFHGTGMAQTGFHWGLATVALLVPGFEILVSGWQGIRQGAPNMNTLIALGTVTAYGTSAIAQVFPQLGWECFFDEPVMLIGAIVLGRGLEQKARQNALSTLKTLSQLQPQLARLWRSHPDTFETSADWIPLTQVTNGGLEIPINRVCVGDYLQVLAGETIPVDGILVQGHSAINEAMITGESIPVEKHPGDRIIAGTVNDGQPILMRTTAIGRDTTLAHIIALVETAQTRKAPIQRLADSVAGYFVYGVIGLAIATFCFWYALGTHLWPHVLMQSSNAMVAELSMSAHHAPVTQPLTPLLLSLKLAIAVLVVSCPCALGLATPVAILVGTTLGAEHGLLIRGGDVLEQLSQVDTWVFDKTGTLTLGIPEVVDIHVTQPELLKAWNSDLKPQQTLLQIAASVEEGTRHPLADAMLKAAQSQDLKGLPVSERQIEPGCGVAAQISGQLIEIGKLAWLEKMGLIPAALGAIDGEQHVTPGTTHVYIAIAHQLAGIITFRDTVRPDAAETLNDLQHAGYQVYLLTGDRRESAEQVAAEIGLDPNAIVASVDPQQKVKYISNLQAEGHRVVMVGDGINDAPALTQANIGMTLQSSTDAALASSALVILSNQLRDIVSALRLSQATLQKVRQNLRWSIAYNLVGIPLAMGCLLPSWGLYLSPATAGAMMCLSSLSVILNSLSLRRVRLKHDL
jgi:P-type Cu2+ transporter